MTDMPADIDCIARELGATLQQIRDAQQGQEFLEIMGKVRDLSYKAFSYIADQKNDTPLETAESIIASLRRNIATMRLRRREIGVLDTNAYDALESRIANNFLCTYYRVNRKAMTFS